MYNMTIPFKLPSYNEYIKACRTNKYAGAKFKEDIEKQIAFIIKNTFRDFKTIDKPCELFIYWYEENKRRDVDNIQSGQKFILDALVKTGILKDDGQKYVKNIHHNVCDGKGIAKVDVFILVIDNVTE